MAVRIHTPRGSTIRKPATKPTREHSPKERQQIVRAFVGLANVLIGGGMTKEDVRKLF